MEELEQKNAYDKQKLKKEKLKSNLKYTKLKLLQNEILVNRRLYIINQRHRHKLESEIFRLKRWKKEQIAGFSQVKKSQDSLQKDRGVLIGQMI